MAITINGSGTITGISAGGLPDNCITAADLATTLDLSGSTLTLPTVTGTIVGRKQAQLTGSYGTNSYSKDSNWFFTNEYITYTPERTDTVLYIFHRHGIYTSNLTNNWMIWGMKLYYKYSTSTPTSYTQIAHSELPYAYMHDFSADTKSVWKNHNLTNFVRFDHNTPAGETLSLGVYMRNPNGTSSFGTFHTNGSSAAPPSEMLILEVLE